MLDATPLYFGHSANGDSVLRRRKSFSQKGIKETRKIAYVPKSAIQKRGSRSGEVVYSAFLFCFRNCISGNAGCHSSLFWTLSQWRQRFTSLKIVSAEGG
ncbi:hypothetical protein CEXT_606161 [Caerostris extrusa]|uniref:Uncharacterized protein n=1 Tax=Caerostris extrusa TaxID=172846 RepID=A0AAV4SDY3_CAEEX|nr:hypothetical protein CEXT_606161 [Caerostris extrusa]